MRRFGLLFFQAIFLGFLVVTPRNRGTEGQLSLGKPPPTQNVGRGIHPDYHHKVSILHSFLVKLLFFFFASCMF